jgi:hypothetical protein
MSTFKYQRIGLSLAIAALSGCGGTSTGNPQISIEYGTYTARNWIDVLIPSAYAVTSNIKLCFKRLRFVPDSSGSGGSSGNQEFYPGEVTLFPTGGSIGTTTVPAGLYKALEFDFEPNCPGSTSGRSVQVSNSNSGSPFTSTSTVTVKFEGSFQALENGQVLRLAFDNIVAALDQVTSDADIKTRLENASVKGSF